MHGWNFTVWLLWFLTIGSCPNYLPQISLVQLMWTLVPWLNTSVFDCFKTLVFFLDCLSHQLQCPGTLDVWFFLPSPLLTKILPDLINPKKHKRKVAQSMILFWVNSPFSLVDFIFRSINGVTNFLWWDREVVLLSPSSLAVTLPMSLSKDARPSLTWSWRTTAKFTLIEYCQ